MISFEQNALDLESRIFNIGSRDAFESLSLEIYRFQYTHNSIYNQYCNHIKRSPLQVNSFSEIPYLPIEFFKTHRVLCGDWQPDLVFTSSGTTGSNTSRHFVPMVGIYEKSFLMGFEHFYGSPCDYIFLALLPGYLERQGSSLIYMMERLIKESHHDDSGFYLHNMQALQQKIIDLKESHKKTFLIGVTHALLEMAEKHPLDNGKMVVMETGGMKGKGRELVREEMHELLRKGFGVAHIHSEYGMTELFSQAYSQKNGEFHCPPWLRITTREVNDPLSENQIGKTGVLNVADLANLYSCSFIATQDLGICHADGSFNILGRMDNAQLRGCNLMVSL